MKTKIAALLPLFFGSALFGQTLVSTTPLNKVAIVEEFTGIHCPNCPRGHDVAADMQTANPGKVIVIGFHPTNSSYTTPGAGEPDFRRSHPDAFYSTPYCGSSRYMPSAFINRREWTGEKIQGDAAWAGYGLTIISESSPVNVGLESDYSAASKTLTINVEVYYTADVTTDQKLNVVLTESGIIGYQSNGGSNYEHNHVFREVFTSQWGDLITGSKSTGSLLTFSFTFDNSTANYNMDNSKVIVYITGQSNDGEAVTGAEVEANGGTTATGVNEKSYPFSTPVVYPNPFSGQTAISIRLNTAENIGYSLYSILGEKIMEENRGRQTGFVTIPLNATEAGLEKGVYLLKVNMGGRCETSKLIVR